MYNEIIIKPKEKVYNSIDEVLGIYQSEIIKFKHTNSYKLIHKQLLEYLSKKDSINDDIQDHYILENLPKRQFQKYFEASISDKHRIALDDNSSECVVTSAITYKISYKEDGSIVFECRRT